MSSGMKYPESSKIYSSGYLPLKFLCQKGLKFPICIVALYSKETVCDYLLSTLMSLRRNLILNDCMILHIILVF